MPVSSGQLLRHQSSTLCSYGSTPSHAGVADEPQAETPSAPSETKVLHQAHVKSTGAGRMPCSPRNPTIHALLNYAKAALPEDQQNASPIEDNTKVSLERHTQIQNLLDTFVSELHPTTTDGETQEIHTGLAIGLLKEVVQRGSAALGDHSEGALKTMLLQATPTVRSNNTVLERKLQSAVNNNEELCLQLGAQALLQVATDKAFAPVGLAGSVGVSAGLGSVWELAAADHAKEKLFGKHFSPTREAFKIAGLDCVPPLPIEAMDTFFVLSIMNRMKGKAMFSSDMVPTALAAGLISAVGAYPNNLLQYLSTGSKAGDITVGTLTTGLAIWTAASGVPMDLKSSEDELRDMLTKQVDAGHLRLPEGEDKDAFVRSLAKEVMNISPDGSIGQKSLGLASLVALIPLILSDKATHLMPEKALRILRSTVFQPIEALTLNALAAWSKMPIAGVQSSDFQRNAELMRLIFERAATSDADKAQKRPSTLRSSEVNHILAPRREVLRHMGQGVAKVMTPVSWAGQQMADGMQAAGTAVVQGVAAGARRLWPTAAAAPTETTPTEPDSMATSHGSLRR